MTEQSWPAPTPRDEVLARVVARGRRIQMVNRLLVVAAVTAAATIAGVGVWLGASGTISLVGGRADAEAPVLPTSSGAVSYVACPGDQPIGELRGGDRVYLTGRDASGEWVEVRAPEGVASPVWVRAEVVDPDGDADLPEAGCELTEAAVGATTTTTTLEDELPEGETTTTTVEDEDEDEPTPTTTTPPATTPTSQPPSPPTTQPDTQGPSITDLQRSQPVIRESSEFCSPYSTPTSTHVSAVVHDPSGVSSVEVGWSFTLGGTQISGSTPATLTDGRYTATLAFPVVAGHSTDQVDVNWSVRALDGAGNVASRSSGPSSAVELQGCMN